MNEIIEIIRIGGPTVAISVVFIWYLDRSDKRNNTIFCNHLDHMVDAIAKNTLISEKNTLVLAQLVKIIDKLVKVTKFDKPKK